MGKWAGIFAGALLLLGSTFAPDALAAAEAPAAAEPPAAAAQTVVLPDGTRAMVQPLPLEKTAPEEPAAVSYPPAPYLVRYERWSETDEKEFGRFIAELGESGCTTVNRCLHDPRNPFRGTDPAGIAFRADCADFPYYLRFYFAWKRGLPFSYVSEIEPRGAAHDMRYSLTGNRVVARVYPGGQNGYQVLDALRDAVSSATYRIHPELEEPYEQDLYSPAISQKSIRPGTVIYDPNGHLAIVWKVERNGRIHYLDTHPDFSVTRGFYDLRFTRALPGMGAGFKNWRPQLLQGARKDAAGVLQGGSVLLKPNREIADFSLEQFFGNAVRPLPDALWKDGSFSLNGEMFDWYDYVRAQMAGGSLLFDPLREIADMVDSNCDDLNYRVQAVDLAIAAGLHKQDEPERLPPNIYGTEGDWETYSTPSRDARLKTAFKELRDTAARFLWMESHRDKKLSYKGRNLARDMLAVYDRHAGQCKISYSRSNGSRVSFGYEEARRRLFEMSFDPYQCPERRWGASTGVELATCPDAAPKAAWYEAERNLRFQIDRTYEARMDFTLAELKTPGPGKGVAAPPDTDLRAFLLKQIEAAPPPPQPKKKSWWK
jgi:hypothetical protein